MPAVIPVPDTIIPTVGIVPLLYVNVVRPAPPTVPENATEEIEVNIVPFDILLPTSTSPTVNAVTGTDVKFNVYPVIFPVNDTVFACVIVGEIKPVLPYRV